MEEIKKRLEAAENAVDELKEQDLLVAKMMANAICTIRYSTGILFQKGEEQESFCKIWSKRLDDVREEIEASQTVQRVFEVFAKFDEELADYIRATKVDTADKAMEIAHSFIKKYSPVLDSKLIADWQRAIGLRAHGIGAGSYVYLRRIIENMVVNAAMLAIKNEDIDQDSYDRSRWPERIKMLSSYLPEYLVKNSKVYGVLSKGVHELTEEECADYFDVMHTSIEIICEEKLAELERSKKASLGSKALQKVLQKL